MVLSGLLCLPALAQVPITAETTDCGGETGFASFDVDRLYKIQSASCPDPEDSSRKLQQILLTSNGRITNYEVLTVTVDEARRVIEKVQAVSQASLEGLTGTDIIIERSEGSQVTRRETAPTRGESTSTLDETRSISSVVTSESPAEESETSERDLFGRYHALVIANASYTHLDDLATPTTDANAISTVLRDRYGFETHMLFDATRYEMLTVLNDMRANLTETDNLLIYFAGHGAFDGANHRGHWLPVDAERDSTANWVSTIDITDLVNAMSARHVLVVADSCYSGALTRSELTSLGPGMSEDLRQQWLRAMAKTRSRHLFTSGGVKPIVDDGGSGHSVFANALIQTLREGSGIIESSVLFREVKQRVSDRAEELQIDQTPQYAKLKRTGHEYGEFMFVAN